MIEMAEYLKSVGITPISILLIALCVWVTSQYFIKYKIPKMRDKDKQILDFLADRLKERASALEELNSLVHEFDHYINHVLEGDKGWYQTETKKRFKQIRSKARERIEFIEDDFPEFLELIYVYTDEEKLVGINQFKYQRYQEIKTELENLFKQIRATLPGMRNDAL
jgi:hypothetical protein